LTGSLVTTALLVNAPQDKSTIYNVSYDLLAVAMGTVGFAAGYAVTALSQQTPAQIILRCMV
jgi:hypothetical protein